MHSRHYRFGEDTPILVLQLTACFRDHLPMPHGNKDVENYEEKKTYNDN